MLERVEGLTTAVAVLLVDCQCDRAHLISRKAKCLDIEVGFGGEGTCFQLQHCKGVLELVLGC